MNEGRMTGEQKRRKKGRTFRVEEKEMHYFLS